MATVEKYQTRSGGTLYAVRYRKPDRGTTMKRGFRTKREAQAWAEDVEVDKRTGTYVAPSLGRITVAELAPAWLARKKQGNKPSTYHSTESAYRTHVAPKWGRASVADIDSLSVETWISEMTGSASSVIRAKGVLSGILDDAVKAKRLASNPCDGVENLPRKTAKRHVYLSDDDVDRLAEESGQHRTLVYLLAYCGLRWGEAIALRVHDIDFLRRRISIHESATQVGAHHEVGPTKSWETRSVPVPQFVIDELSAQCTSKARGDLVFPGNDGRYLKRPDSKDGWFVVAVKRAGVQKITPHDLRHTCASIAVSEGANVLALTRMLGHKSAAMTLDTYSDLFDSDLDAVAVALDARHSRSSVLNSCSPRAHDAVQQA